MQPTYTTVASKNSIVEWACFLFSPSDWLCGYWAFDKFSVVSERNRQSKLSMHCYGTDRHVRKMQRMVRKTHNFNSQLLLN
jgi:hypothetical protein